MSEILDRIFHKAGIDFARAAHIGRKRIIRKELEHFNLHVWLERHIEWRPQCNYLSADAEMAVRSHDIVAGLKAVRQCYDYWKVVSLANWSYPDATRKHHLDCLKTLYHGQARKLLNNHAKAVGELVTGQR